MQGFSVAIYVQSTNLVYQRGTVTRFKNPARHMYQRCAQCRGKFLVFQKLAHLLAAQTHATPKQAKEPITVLTYYFYSSNGKRFKIDSI
jgi:hypothetical protein